MDAKNATRRKMLQEQHANAYAAALGGITDRVRDYEGLAMREGIQDKVHTVCRKWY